MTFYFFSAFKVILNARLKCSKMKERNKGVFKGEKKKETFSKKQKQIKGFLSGDIDFENEDLNKMFGPFFAKHNICFVFFVE